ncbi:hypothetical protein E3Q12_00907 [Wallemia mellicola]|nr:hypothetical protein E3Q12_00907 [Wallemia mellicola]
MMINTTRASTEALTAASISSEISDHPYNRPEERPKSKTKIPRPPNAWILYRSESIEEMKNTAGTDMSKLNQTELSKMIGIKWRSENIQVKHIYQEKANEARREHMLKYPQYKFRPNRKHDRIAKIGTRTVRSVSHHRKTQITKTAQKTQKNHKNLKTKTPLKQLCSSDGEGEGDDGDYDYKCSQRAERQLRRNVKVRGERRKRCKQEEEVRTVDIMRKSHHHKGSDDRYIRPGSPLLSLPDPTFTLPMEVENDMTNISTNLVHDSDLGIYDSNALVNQNDNRISFDDFAYDPEVMFAPETATNLANEWANNNYVLGTDVGVDNVIGVDNYHYINDIFGNIPTTNDIAPLPPPPSAFKYMNDMMDISSVDLGTIYQDDRVGISSSCSSSSTVSTTSTTHSLDSYDNCLPDFLNVDITEGLNDTHIGERARSLIADYYLYEEREEQQQQLQFQQEHQDIPTQQDIFKTFQRQLAETRTRVSQNMT